MNIKTYLAAGVALLMTAPAFASPLTASDTMQVSATVTPACHIVASPLDFGSFDATTGNAVAAPGSVSVTCTKDTAYTVGADAGSGSGATFAARQMPSNGNLLQYSLFTDASHTSVWGDGTSSSNALSGNGSGSSDTVNFYGQIAAGQTTAPAGDYSDTVTVTVSY